MEARLKQVRNFTNTLNGTQPMQNGGGGQAMNLSINAKLLTFIKITLVAMIGVLILSCTTNTPKPPTKIALKLGTLRFDKEEIIFKEPAQTKVQSLETVVIEINNTSKTVPFEAVLVQDEANPPFNMDGKCIDDGEVKSGTKKPNCAITFFFTPQQTGDNTATLKLTINKGNSKLEESVELPVSGQGTHDQGIKGLKLYTAIADNGTLAENITNYIEGSDIPLVLTEETTTGNIAKKRIFMKVKNTNAANGASVQFLTKITKGGSMFLLDSSTCTGSLAPASECYTTIKFIPESEGDNFGAFALTSAGKTLEQPLNGKGKFPQAEGGLMFSTKILTFPPVIQYMRSEPVTITVKNTAPGTITGRTELPLKVTNIKDLWNYESFDYITTCETGANASLAPGDSCTVQVTFWPAFFDDPVKTRSVGVNGDGIMYKLFGTNIEINPVTGLKKPENIPTEIPNLKVSTSSHYFGKQLVNTTSASAVIKLIADGGSVDVAVTPTLAPFKLTDDFDTVCKRENNRVRLGTGESCELRVVFNPAAVKLYNSTLTLSSGIGDLLRVFDIPLTGQGIIQTKALSFGAVAVNNLVTKTFTFANSSKEQVKIKTVTIEGAQKTSFTMKQTAPDNSSCIDKNSDQSVTNATALSIPSGESCTIDIGFTTRTDPLVYKSEIVLKKEDGSELTRAQLSGTNKKNIFIEFAPKGVQLDSNTGEGTIGINGIMVYAIGGNRGGGQDANMRDLNTLPHIYDIATNIWKVAFAKNIEFNTSNPNNPYVLWNDSGGLSTVRNTTTTTNLALYDNKIYVIAGRSFHNPVVKYSAVNQHDLTPVPGFSDGEMKLQISQKDAKLAGVDDMDRGFAAVSQVGGKIFIFGGQYYLAKITGGFGGNYFNNSLDRMYDMSKLNSTAFENPKTGGGASPFFTRLGAVGATVDNFVYVYGGTKQEFGESVPAGNEMYVYRPDCTSDTAPIKFMKDNPSSPASYTVDGGGDLPKVAQAAAVGINSKVEGESSTSGVIYYTGGGLNGLYQLKITRADLEDVCSGVTAVWSKVNSDQPGIDAIKTSARLINVDGELWIHNGTKMLHYIAQ